MKHDHAPAEHCGTDCPNQIASRARSASMRCTCGRINCPNITHATKGKQA